MAKKSITPEEYNEMYENVRPHTIRVYKHERAKNLTSMEINQGIQGDTIEGTLERIRNGEGEESIQDRDLVYNDNESTTVNPVTNIRTDKFEAMLEEKIGQYEHQHRKNKVINEDIDKIVNEENENLNNQQEGSTHTEGKTE